MNSPIARRIESTRATIAERPQQSHRRKQGDPMIMTSAKGLELSMRAPKFSLPDTSGRIVSIDDFSASPALLVVFWCNHCPAVIHIKHGFAQFGREYQTKGLRIVAINSNDSASHPEDRPERMRDDIETFGYTFD